MIENTDWKEIVLPKETEMTREEIFKKNFPQYVTEKGMCLSPFWDLFDAGIEAATSELNKGIIQVLTKENAELKETVTKMNNVIIGTFSNLTKAKEIIEELSKSLFLAKGIVRDLIDDTVDFKESKERAIYCYKQEKFDTYKEAVQFLKELSE